jgi:putative Holliday junction resolvase
LPRIWLRRRPCHGYDASVRVLAIDFGLRRVGLAISDPTATLARPLRTIATEDRDPTGLVAEVVAALVREEEGLSLVVVGLPCRLDGTPHELTARVHAFAEALQSQVALPIVLRDERLTSHEAEARLAERYRDWRTRKSRLDAAAAAIILQEYLDDRSRGLPTGRPEP